MAASAIVAAYLLLLTLCAMGNCAFTRFMCDDCWVGSQAGEEEEGEHFYFVGAWWGQLFWGHCPCLPKQNKTAINVGRWHMG